MELQYDLEFCPEATANKLPEFIQKEIKKRGHYSKENYAQVVWNPATYKIELSIFYKDDFPLDFKTFSTKDLK